jgi:hypothetical protein
MMSGARTSRGELNVTVKLTMLDVGLHGSDHAAGQHGLGDTLVEYATGPSFKLGISRSGMRATHQANARLPHRSGSLGFFARPIPSISTARFEWVDADMFWGRGESVR